MEKNITISEYKELVERLNEWSRKYYVESEPVVSDAVFDCEYRRLQKVEAEHPEWVTPDSPTQRVGSDLKNGRKVVHQRKMLSLAKAYSMADIKAFMKSVGENEVVVHEHKYDGLSVSLIYQNGVLVQASTRGDGAEGMDVTENVRKIKAIPQDIREDLKSSVFSNAESLEVRGEVVMTYAAFDNINNRLRASGKKEYANPRNAASGILCGNNPNACSMLTMMAWDAYPSAQLVDGLTHTAVMTVLKGLGFKVDGAWLKPFVTTWPLLDSIEHTRQDLRYPIDGVVIKVNDRSKWELLGETATAPRWAIAYKFKTSEWESTFRGVEWKDEKDTGKLTPVIQFDEVEMYGTKCHQINLGTYNNFVKRVGGIRVGDKVVVTKSGECVPTLVRWHSVGENGEAAVSPVVCPICGTPVVQDGCYLRCPRPDKHAAARIAKDKPQAQALPSRVNKFALRGMSIVVSGEFTKRYSREQIESLVERAGGRLVKSISGNTAFLVKGDKKPGPSKVKKCETLGVPMISEDEFLRKIV